ncbi:hypothetical protein DVA67_007975 [Solirubrobacter sp. CPCC 204708]|nr:hypothetical protein [Solirubrobacter deserti]
MHGRLSRRELVARAGGGDGEAARPNGDAGDATRSLDRGHTTVRARCAGT